MPERQFINYYHCPNDGWEWVDVWSCSCNDRCPKCGAEIESYKSEVATHPSKRNVGAGRR